MTTLDHDTDLAVWPASARQLPGGDVAVGGVALAEIARDFGTPTYVLDEAEVRSRCRTYRQAFPDAHVQYAAKAFLSRTMARWVHEEGLGIDACSAGEQHLAVAAGVPARDVLVHGSAKTPADLHTALDLGVGRIVIDSLSEVRRLATQVPDGHKQRVLIRVVPGISAGAHHAIRTGTDDQHFGLAPADGVLSAAVSRILAQPQLELVGLHCHLGSQITEIAPFLAAVTRMVSLTAMVRDRFGLVLPELDLGGGHGVAYRPGDPALDVAELGVQVTEALQARCAVHQLPVPQLTIEPGRAVVGPAGIALYRVVSVKRTPQHTWVAVDGGMSDNPRPALYGQRYTPRLVGQRERPAAPLRSVTVVGRHCEAGDVIAADVPLPADVRAGDLLAVPVAGAYHLSMASTYNMVGRPPVVAVHDGVARLLVRRETVADLIDRDVAD
ncbi:diaminopimelate decarboxylase [Rhodococcus sp. X156]|uniref:diaminopimelate decarboxylase n=1 Tax=Rhodococcus sp. X156 TaxID=2499145 RepID=UPI000FD9FB2E|nr:diaminopimelate decarboxylase [Rhodococcus sp. X156]